MAHLNNTFSSPNAGSLFVTFSGEFFTTFSNTGGAFNRGAADFAVRCMVKSGATLLAETVISLQSVMASSVMLDYPGGNVSWTVQTETLSHVFAGNVGTMGANNLRARVRLAKR